MQYTDYFLKFADEAEARAVLYRMKEPSISPWPVEAAEESGRQAIQVKAEPYEVPNFRAIDLIGTIYKPTGNLLKTDEGEVQEMAPIDGWHVNVRLCEDEAGEALEDYRVYPATPVRMWA